ATGALVGTVLVVSAGAAFVTSPLAAAGVGFVTADPSFGAAAAGLLVADSLVVAASLVCAFINPAVARQRYATAALPFSRAFNIVFRVEVYGSVSTRLPPVLQRRHSRESSHSPIRFTNSCVRISYAAEPLLYLS